MFLTALTQERGHVQIQLFMDLAPRLAEQPQHCQQWRLLSDHRPKNEGQRVLQWDQCLSHILCPGRGWHDRLCRWVVSRACCLCDTKIVGTDKISKLRKHDEVSCLRKEIPLQWLDVRRTLCLKQDTSQDNYTRHQHVLIKKHKIQLLYTYALPALLWFGHLETFSGLIMLLPPSCLPGEPAALLWKVQSWLPLRRRLRRLQPRQGPGIWLTWLWRWGVWWLRGELLSQKHWWS